MFLNKTSTTSEERNTHTEKNVCVLFIYKVVDPNAEQNKRGLKQRNFNEEFTNRDI